MQLQIHLLPLATVAYVGLVSHKMCDFPGKQPGQRTLRFRGRTHMYE